MSTNGPRSYPGSRSEEQLNELLNRISVYPQICRGEPCVRGTRIWASLLLGFLASGFVHERNPGRVPQLTREDLLAAIDYGAHMAPELLKGYARGEIWANPIPGPTRKRGKNMVVPAQDRTTPIAPLSEG